MTIKNNDFSTKGYSYKIDLASERGGMWLDRTFTLRTNETVSFSVKIEPAAEMTLVDLHQQSIQRAIEILQAALNPEPDQQPKPGSLASQLA